MRTRDRTAVRVRVGTRVRQSVGARVRVSAWMMMSNLALGLRFGFRVH